MLDIYLDIQNFYNRVAQGAPYINVVRDAQGNALTDPSDASRYQTKLLQNPNGTIIPTIGVIVEI
jgi:hypothetical protein